MKHSLYVILCAFSRFTARQTGRTGGDSHQHADNDSIVTWFPYQAVKSTNIYLFFEARTSYRSPAPDLTLQLWLSRWYSRDIVAGSWQSGLSTPSGDGEACTFWLSIVCWQRTLNPKCLNVGRIERTHNLFHTCSGLPLSRRVVEYNYLARERGGEGWGVVARECRAFF